MYGNTARIASRQGNAQQVFEALYASMRLSVPDYNRLQKNY
jgi:hypothetical protein